MPEDLERDLLLHIGDCVYALLLRAEESHEYAPLAHQKLAALRLELLYRLKELRGELP